MSETFTFRMRISTGAQIIAGYMSDIAKRAIELNDEKLLELLQGLEIISKTEEKEA